MREKHYQGEIRMKLSMMSYTMARGVPPDKISIPFMCALAKELGMDGIDMVTTYGRDPREVRKIVDDHGLKVVCYTFSLDVNFPDAQGRAAGVDGIKKNLDVAVTLGADKVMLVTPGKKGFTREESRRNIIASIQEAMPAARQAGVTMTVENFPGATSPFLISSDILAAVAVIPDMRLTFDNGNVVTGGEDPGLSFERTKDYAVHSHFKDWMVVGENEGFKGLDGRNYRGALIGEGIVDQKGCLRAMKKCGYTGYINIEYEGNIYTPEVAVRRANDYLRGLMAELGI
jgi:sugar phosphate isomerase/epimerase